MVCERCQLKTSKVICPEVGKKPLYKQLEESKGPSTQKKIVTKVNDDCIDFGGVTTSKLDEATLGDMDDRMKSGQSMAIHKGIDQKKGFDPLAMKCKICKVSQVLKGHHYCQKCSYAKGICGMCGKKILDTKMYKQKNF